jgi:hypothetical protein
VVVELLTIMQFLTKKVVEHFWAPGSRKWGSWLIIIVGMQIGLHHPLHGITNPKYK